MRHPGANAVAHKLRLVALIEGGIQSDRVATLPDRAEVLAQPPRVVRDQAVRGRQDGPGGTVVLLQSAEPRGWEVPAILMQVFDTRATPAINRLVIVTDGEGVALAAHEQLHPSVLNGVRV